VNLLIRGLGLTTDELSEEQKQTIDSYYTDLEDTFSRVLDDKICKHHREIHKKYSEIEDKYLALERRSEEIEASFKSKDIHQWI
jgi:hypothetical protein